MVPNLRFIGLCDHGTLRWARLCLTTPLEALSAGIEHAAAAARSGANKTAEMKTAGAGRAAYVGEKQLSGHIDPGAEAVARVFDRLAL